MFDDAGTVVRYIGVQHDVTARVEAERALLQERDRNQQFLARIQELAYTDPLTGLPNRRRLQEQVETAIWSARAGEDTLALLFVDLNGFKAVNDAPRPRGRRRAAPVGGPHAAGPLRRSDLLARLGGDEFLVALTGLDPATTAAEARAGRRRADRGRAARVALRDREVAVGASVGVAVYPADGEEFEALLHAADLSMYAHKAAEGAALTQPSADPSSSSTGKGGRPTPVSRVLPRGRSRWPRPAGAVGCAEGERGAGRESRVHPAGPDHVAGERVEACGERRARGARRPAVHGRR